MNRGSWVAGFVLTGVFLALAALPQPAAHAGAKVAFYTLTITPPSNGTLNPSPPMPSEGYTMGTVVTLTATANPGYAFSAWTGPNGAEVQPSVLPVLGSGTITMNGNKTVSAAFVLADTTPPTGTIVINNNHTATKTPNVALSLTWDDGTGSGVTRMRFSDNGTTWTAWEALKYTRAYALPTGDGYKTVRVQYLDIEENRSLVYNDYIRLDTVAPTGGIVINSGAANTTTQAVTLKLNWADTGSGVTRMRFSDNGSTWTAWESQKATRAYTLPAGLGNHTVRVQFTDAAENYSPVYSDYIKIVAPTVETVFVAAGTFTMGRTATGDDATYGFADELPTHSVSLSGYKIGKYEVTNKQYCDVLNWALAQGYLKTDSGVAWTGTGDIYAGGDLQRVVAFTDTTCNIRYSGGLFSSKTRTGLPGTTSYSMNAYPVNDVSWYGSVAFCNWLSQMQGLSACYNMTTPDWPLTVPFPAGYRLPTEAEWERAAAWDGAKHWIYGCTADTLTGQARVNYWAVNPFGLTTYPWLSPVGWFNGLNVSLNGSVQTVNSPSPVGCYDMSANVSEWCTDHYAAYGADPQTNPAGPATGVGRVFRGGAWDINREYSRTAFRQAMVETSATEGLGFRVAMTP